MFANFLNARRDRKELLRQRTILAAITDLIGAHDIALMIRIGSRVRTNIERRFSSESEIVIGGDGDLDREELRVEFLPPEKLSELSRNFSMLADRAGTNNEDIAEAMSCRLLAGWFIAKAIARRNTNKKIVKEARGLDEVCFLHIKNFLKVVRGELTKVDRVPNALLK
jgi:hypothetical protein